MDLRVTDYRREGRCAVITLTRPERGNAWTGRLHAEYKHCLSQAESDDQVRVIVVTGAGWAFCVGGDAEALDGHAERGHYDDGLAQAGDRGWPSAEAGGPAPGGLFSAEFAYHFALSKPVIAALNGPAAGIGLALACFCDLRFAVPGAKLTTAHGKLALPPEYGLSWLLPRQIGLGRAMDLLLTSRVFTTDEAYTLGLVNQLHQADQLMDQTVRYAEQLASTVSRDALEATRRMVYLDLHRGIDQSVEESRRRLNDMMGLPDYRRGVAALRAKRPPEF